MPAPSKLKSRRTRQKIEVETDRFLGGQNLAPWQKTLNRIIFGVDTLAGRVFDIILLLTILFSVLVVMLESVASIHQGREKLFLGTEWFLTALFTVEYLLRLACVERPLKYAFSFYGIIDFLAILPSYLRLFIPGLHTLTVIRSLRLLRIFRILKITHCLREAQHLWIALRATQSKIAVFLLVVLTLILIMGSTMYLIEGPQHGFTSIPKSIYWAIVTMTTVGYGDIAPQTVPGQILASVAMILGYGIIIVPTGIFSVEVIAANRAETHVELACTQCELDEHELDARFCRHCGAKLPVNLRNQDVILSES